DINRVFGSGICITVHGADPIQPATVEFDNLKVWDLDNLDNSSTRTSEKENMAQMYVPAGEFMMGSNNGEEDEKPMHSVYLDAFWIDRTEISNQQYMECVAEKACTRPSSSYRSNSTDAKKYYGISTFKDYPVIFVSLSQAKEYCVWAGRRLPSEAEWEKTARGTDNRKFPWGNEINGTYLNFGDKNGVEARNLNWDDGYAETAPVGNYPMGASPYGALDMARNVWEYVADWYDREYHSISPQSNPAGSSSGDLLVRGGSFGDDFELITTTYRLEVGNIDAGDYAVGFRCAQSATP
ncbi:MAG: SUMF1/EgtB/PvdO family nonheme iron enzyme, partial [Anaerolineales bacterium]